MGSAIIKFQSRLRAKEVGVSYYESTLIMLEFDCVQNQYKVSMVYDRYKSGELIPLNVADVNIWKNFTNSTDRNAIAFSFVCK